MPSEAVREVLLDGSEGEGGGQILRTALSLSAATGRPFRIVRIRARRPNPGLAAQHLAAVRAAAATCSAAVEGDRVGSQELEFRPLELRPLREHFEIGTAGATTLVLQTIALPLALAPGDSEVSVGGGTHVEWAPAFDYLWPHWTGWMARLGLGVRARLARAGYYPKGGGLIRSEIAGGAFVRPLELREEPGPLELRGRVVITRLDERIARRIARTAEHEFEREGLYAPVEIAHVEGPESGVAFFVYASRGGLSTACTSSLGRRGKPAELVAREASRAMLAHLATGAALDPHLADQLVAPLALAGGESRYTTSELTPHLLTNLRTAAAFTGLRYEVKGETGAPGEVRIVPAGD